LTSARRREHGLLALVFGFLGQHGERALQRQTGPHQAGELPGVDGELQGVEGARRPQLALQQARLGWLAEPLSTTCTLRASKPRLRSWLRAMRAVSASTMPRLGRPSVSTAS
jgi:hypothetical protein